MSASETGQLAEFISGLDGSAIPEKARTEVRRALLDYLGVALRGSVEDAAQIARRFAKRQHGGGKSVLFGDLVRVGPVGAAFANGIAGHALDFDDIGLE